MNKKGQTSDGLAWGIIAVFVALVVAFSALSSTAGDDRGPEPLDTSGATTLDVDIQGMTFTPNRIDVPSGTRLILTITNSDDQQHDLKLGNEYTGRIDPGDTVVHDFGVFTESTQGWCTIAGHKAMGMVFDVVVGSASPSTSPSAAPRPVVAADGPDSGLVYRDPALPPAPDAPERTVHEHTWHVAESERQVAPGVTQPVWTFDGEMPGPVLRGRVGDLFRITIVNDGTMEHSIDFHAGEVNPDTNMAQIAPGESLTYEFEARRYGIWMYHCATMPMSLHIANGMFGAVVIDPPDLTPVDAEYVLLSHEVFLGEDGADPERVAAGLYDLTAFNGYPNQYQQRPIPARVGDTVRVWIFNVGPDNPLSFHVVGEIFDTVFKEGQYQVRNATDTGSQALGLLAAQGGFVEMTFDEPGTYTFVNHQMTDAEKGQRGQFVVTP
ncbi:multicopper oxidase domain-containing protein [Corynebacterium pseudogenitalium]|uniref:multicopper oxidase domain-containing protein n=1 Tax=Corynebacterium pseudogenitalium TaxID=38303 RepID=UPI0021088A30|nr:multicopper oxidase domain-containing protein [Corynebacterium pseudogenitalium]UUA87347.1 multicopper oxidase domain-containing protein [Corynebacterium pseudogenitalium]